MFGDPYLSPKYSKRPFLDCLDFNPGKTEVRDLPDETMVSFVPMESVGTDGSIDVSKKKTLGEVRKGYTYFRDNDVVFAKITPCFENGKVAIASGCQNGIGFGTTEFHVARPIDGVSNSTWLLTLLRSNSLRHLASGNMSGTAGQKRVQQPFFEKLSIGLPPIEEQEKFAKFYNQVDKSRVIFVCIIKSRFIEMFGNPVQSDKYPRIKFGSIIKNIVNGMGSPPQFSDEGYAFIRATNIENGSIVNRDMLHISEETALKLEKYKVHTGDFIFVRSGAYAGDVCVIPDEYDGQYGAYDINVQIDQEKTNPVFLNTLFNSNYMESVIRPLTSRSAQPHLNTKQVAGLDILVPPMELQNEFVDFVKQVDKSRVDSFELTMI